jgi:YbbR domain-containing protein
MRLLLANWREKIISLVLAGVLFAYVDNLKIGTVALNLPVVYTGMPQSLAFAEDPPRFLEVRLRGDKERLNFPTSKMRVEIDMKGAVVERMSYPVTLDERLLPEGVSFVEPPQFLRIKLERSVQRIVFIRPIVSGTPDAGFRRGRVTVQPDRVVIRGAEEKIRAVRELTAGPIDISGAQATLTRPFFLKEPPGVDVVGGPEVQLTVQVIRQEEEAERQLDAAISLRNVPAGLTAAVSPPSVRILVQGEAEVIGDLDPADVEAFVDLTGLELTGDVDTITVDMPVKFNLLKRGIRAAVASSDPEFVSVKFEKAK